MSVTSTNPYDGILRLEWSALADDDTGDTGELGRYREGIVIQASGTFDSQTLSMEGSLDGVTFFALTTDGSTPIAITANDIATPYETVGYIRPVMSDEGGTVEVSVTVEGMCYI